MRKKSFVAFVLSIVIMLDILPIYAFAQETAVYSPVSFLYDETVDYSPAAVSSDEADISAVTDLKGLTKVILEAVSGCVRETDISSFNIPLYLVSSVSHYIWYNLPEAFNLKGTSYTYNERTKLLETVIFDFCTFADTAEEYASCHKEFLKAAGRLLDGIEGNGNLSDVKKALLLHDRLAVNTQYDYDFYTDTELKHSAYGALVKKTAVCQGYALAYMYLLDRVGIKNSYCSSDALNHAWNIVYIDGKPYHTDVTWDDVSWDSYERGVEGMVRHNNFLRSTKGLFEQEHAAADYDKSPVDTTYDDFFWQDSECEFQLIGNDIYYLDNTNGAIRKYGDTKNLADVSDIWMAGYPHYWIGNFARLSSDGENLLYSKTDGVYSLTLKNKKTEKIYSPALKGDMAIYGFTLRDGFLVCDINDGPPYSQLGMERLTQVKAPYEKKNAPEILKIEINTLPEKTVYFSDEKADIKGLTLTVTYKDKSKKIISDGFSCSFPEKFSIGKNTVTVNYEDFSVSFEITVNCIHKETVVHPEIPPTDKTTGLTQGVFCITCGNYISGREEIPAGCYIKNNDSIVLEDDFVCMKPEITVSQLLSQAVEGSFIRRPDGRIVKDMSEKPTTGWTVVISGTKELPIVVRGDIDGDGDIASTDARIALRTSVGYESFSKSSPSHKAADISSDKEITASDARQILRGSVGLEDTGKWTGK